MAFIFHMVEFIVNISYFSLYLKEINKNIFSGICQLAWIFFVHSVSVSLYIFKSSQLVVMKTQKVHIKIRLLCIPTMSYVAQNQVGIVRATEKVSAPLFINQTNDIDRLI